MANLPDDYTENPERPAVQKPDLTYPIMKAAVVHQLDRLYGPRQWHCDHIWADKSLPMCVIDYLDVARAPATQKLKMVQPPLFATFEGKRVRVVMASRFGDVGITENLDDAEYGYSQRVLLPELSDFASTP